MHIQAYLQSYTCPGIFGHIRTFCSRFRHIKDSCITGPDSLKHHLLVMLTWNISELFRRFFHFCFKSKHSTFFFQDSISIITIIKACHPRQHTTQVNMPLTPITLHMLTNHPRHQRQDATLASSPPNQVRHPRRTPLTQPHQPGLPRQYVTDASMPPMLPTLTRIAHNFSNSFKSIFLYRPATFEKV